MGFVLLVGAHSAYAGRPLSTEDASILDEKACQLEAWVDRGRDDTRGWIVPACNFGLGIEWQVGFSQDEAYGQAKGLLRQSTDESPWAAGWVVGVLRDNPYVLVPVSWTLDDLTLHVQPGWARTAEGRNLTIWGVAAEYAVHERWDLVGEVFGENSERPFVRAGLRWTPIKDRLDVDLTYVTRPGGSRDDRLVSFGITWYGGPFLP